MYMIERELKVDLQSKVHVSMDIKLKNVSKSCTVRSLLRVKASVYILEML